MNIKIGNYVLHSDSNQFILKQEKTRQEGNRKGEKYMDTVGFYPRLESAIESIVQRVAMGSDAKDLATLADEIRAYKDIVRDALVGGE